MNRSYHLNRGQFFGSTGLYRALGAGGVIFRGMDYSQKHEINLGFRFEVEGLGLKSPIWQASVGERKFVMENIRRANSQATPG